MGVLFITHDLDLAAAVCDRVYVMYAGRIVESASANDVFGAPRHPYTAGLLGLDPRPLGSAPAADPDPGRPPEPAGAARGCAFASRCAFVVEGRCERRASPAGRRPRARHALPAVRAELAGDLVRLAPQGGGQP